ncbi:hypothetical protein ACJ73_00694 [Blastomyces percursus]|uniref:Uncharacterized protein n=1 Tax=Blastomyces percursus TaxID=1658174 RepID=A0A1J9RJX0_9EURO|nr:hypothetical protein ACJ73_00694 [Blastomyces percursus]
MRYGVRLLGVRTGQSNSTCFANSRSCISIEKGWFADRELVGSEQFDQTRVLKAKGYLEYRFIRGHGIPCFPAQEDYLLGTCMLKKEVATAILSRFYTGFVSPEVGELGTIDRCHLVVEATLDWQDRIPAEVKVLQWSNWGTPDVSRVGY